MKRPNYRPFNPETYKDIYLVRRHLLLFEFTVMSSRHEPSLEITLRQWKVRPTPNFMIVILSPKGLTCYRCLHWLQHGIKQKRYQSIVNFG